MTVDPTDLFLVNRADSTSTVVAKDLMAKILDDDLMVVNRGDQAYSVTGADVKESLGSKPIFPEPDEISSSPAFTGGTGTSGDPFLLKTIDVRPGGAIGVSEELITIDVAGATEDDLVVFTDNSVGVGTRFAQPTRVVGASGSWVGRLVYSDTPATTTDTAYTGDIQIGDVYFRWTVEQGIDPIRPIAPTPAEVTATPAFVSGTGTAGDPYICSASTAAPAGATVYSTQEILIVEVGGAPGELVRWTNNSDASTGGRFDQPEGVTDGSAQWKGRIVYNDIPDTTVDQTYVGQLKIGTTYFQWDVAQRVVAAEVITPTIIAPPDGAGIGGGVTYTPKTSAIASAVTGFPNWTREVTPQPNEWYGVTYGNGTFVAVSKTGTNRAAYSADGTNWQMATGVLDTEIWGEVAYNPATNRFVAIAISNSTNAAMYSDDNGKTWVYGSTPVQSGGYTSIAYGNGKFVAVGSNKAVWSTDNGETFLNCSLPSNMGTLKSVTYGNGKFVAVSKTKTATYQIMTSPDGSTFQGVTAATSNEWTSVTYGNGKFVAIAESGSNGGVMYSATGEEGTWSYGGVTGTQSTNWSAITHGGDKFVAVAGSGPIMWSYDGIAWSSGPQYMSGTWLNVTYGDDRFVAVARTNGTTAWNTYIEKSSLTLADANTYNADTDEDMGQPISETFTAGQTVTGVKAGSDNAIGTLLADASGNTMSIEPYDGPLFKLATATEANSWWSIAYGNGKFVAVSLDGTNQVMYSADGITWAATSAAESLLWTSVTYGNGKFVAVGYRGTNNVMYSDDGISWTSATAAENNEWSAVTYGELPDGTKRFVAVSGNGTNQVMYSADGISWTSASTGIATTNWVSITYGDGKFVAIAYANYIIVSSDGINWTESVSPEVNGWSSVTYGNGRFVAIAQNGPSQVMYSTDAINWTLSSLPQLGGWSSITYGDGKFVAVAGFGTYQVMYSADGINWILTAAPGDNGWKVITYGDGKFVAVTGGGSDPRGMSADSNFGGDFVDGMEVINSTDVTKAAPSADDLEFVGSTPTDNPLGSIVTWGDATWEVSTDSAFTAPMVGTKIITAGSNQTLMPAERGAIVLEGDTEYWAQLSYNATDPALPNVTSSAVHFKTADNAVSVDDIFNVTVYAGSNDDVQITNGVDVSTNALVWIKGANLANDHILGSSVRDPSITLSSNLEDPEFGAETSTWISYNSDGYTVLGNLGPISFPGYDYVGYSFKAAPNFFNIVEWVGDGNPMQVPHNLGQTPKVIIAKGLSQANDWHVYHAENNWANGVVSPPADNFLVLNENNTSSAVGGDIWNPTETTFQADPRLGKSNAGQNYVAYLFGDTPGLIKCGGYVGDDTQNRVINTDPAGTGGEGYFQPQWIMIKNATSASNWMIFDDQEGGFQSAFFANSSSPLETVPDWGGFRVGGFSVSKNATSTDNFLNTSGETYVYIAIAKGSSTRFFDTEAFQAITDNEVIARYGVDPYTTNLEPLGIKELTHEPVGVTAAFAEVQNSNKLEPVQALENTVNGLQEEVKVADAKLEIVKERNKQLKRYMAKDMIADAQALIEQWAAEDAGIEEGDTPTE